MKFLRFAWVVMVACSGMASAMEGPDAASELRSEEGTDTVPAEVRADPDGDLQNELSYRQNERRAGKNRGVALAIGPVVPWGRYGVGLSHHREDGMGAWVVDVGVGRRVQRGGDHGDTYQLDLATQGAFGAYRFYLAKAAPFFVQPVLGVVAVEGELAPQEADTQAAEAPRAHLGGHVDALGWVGGAALGLSWMSEAGWVVEWLIVGGAGTKVSGFEYSNPDGAGASMAEQAIESFQTWGLLNLKVGWAFQ